MVPQFAYGAVLYDVLEQVLLVARPDRRDRRGTPAASVSAASTSARIARSEREATSGSLSPSTWT